MGRVGIKSGIKHCIMCGSPFEAHTAWHKYCSRPCETRRYRESRGLGRKLATEGRYCRQCGTHFFPDPHTGKNRQHCSDECSKKSARESRSKFYEKNPEKAAEYRERTKAKRIPGNNLARLYKRFPNAPKACEACGESRVLDIAHKPGHERNGSWRSKANTAWPEKVWILCPTCHAVIDRLGTDPAELGLK